MKIKNFFTIFALGAILTLASCNQETKNYEKSEVDIMTTNINTTKITDLIPTSTLTEVTGSTSTVTSIVSVKNSVDTTTTTTVNVTTKRKNTECLELQQLCYNNENTAEVLETPINTEIDYSNVETVQKVNIDSYSKLLLAEIVYHEAGSAWIDTYEKARIVAGVMNRVYDERFPSTVYDVLTQEGQFTGYWPGCVTPNEDCYIAVDYYFAHSDLFGNENSWYGTGYENIFYYQ